MKPKHQRLVLVVAALAALVAAVLLAMWGLRDQASYFLTPADIAADKAADGRPFRLGGMVETGSVQREPDGVTIRRIAGCMCSSTRPLPTASPGSSSYTR